VVVGAAAALRANLHNLLRGLDGFQGCAVVFHGFGEGLFAVHVAACFHGLNGVQRVLEVGGAHKNGVHDLLVVHLFVVAVGHHVVPHLLFPSGGALFPSSLPDVGHAHQVEV
jgi:hypothetical protein